MLEGLNLTTLLIYGLPFLAAFAWYIARNRRSERE